jgi:tetratricopeptide (TPR) repeat protein
MTVRTIANFALFALGALALTSLSLAPATAQDQEKDTVTLATRANKAALAYNGQQWAQAKEDFRFCIGQRPTAMEYYEGLYNTCMRSGEWDQVAYALDKMFAIDPNQKTALAYQYGQALFHLNRFDEAIPYLKKALTTVNIPEVDYIPKKHEIPTTEPTIAYVAPTPPPPPKPYAPIPLDESTALSFLNAATHSECICLAEYKGYDKSPDISWNHSPQAQFRITEILKGPPLNANLPVKFEFHDSVKTDMPKDWKFSDKVMPEKDSKWILFIEFAVPKRNMFEMYQGSYGRQPANDENLNNLYALLDKYNMRNTHS